ncbi:MAG: histidinol dehydrogenase [Candidatus Sumerlaeota bacterium]|nr:histidinol dehydrogenase [Candidatus Sumerlaeota bacterium]
MLIFQYPARAEEVKSRLRATVSRQPAIEKAVGDIIAAVRERGDKAVLEFTRRFDHVSLRAERLRVPPAELRRAWEGMERKVRGAIELSAARIKKFHTPQKPAGYIIRESSIGRLEYRISPIPSVGLYVPGGMAAYPSSLLMNAIPALLAGVGRIVVATPPGAKGNVNPVILGTAHFLGLREVYRIGGAQAIAAFAFGTKTIPRVDKVVGPGNAYVATAKRLLYGIIDIDMIAGPSEILIIADGSAPLSFIVADLLSQAEHDPMSVPILIYVGRLNERAFCDELERQIAGSPRGAIIRRALDGQWMVIVTRSLAQAVELANMKAPEHLEVMVKQPEEIIPGLKNAGAIFVGQFTPEPVGDYVAGPNHVLPTMGTARFFSPLSVTAFMKATSILHFTRAGIKKLGPAAICLAEEEGLPAHANAIRIRLEE